jgi:hypothetical protein
LEYQEPNAQFIADQLLKQAITADENKPNDDMSVVIMRVQPTAKDQIRRLNVTLPIELSTTSTQFDY